MKGKGQVEGLAFFAEFLFDCQKFCKKITPTPALYPSSKNIDSKVEILDGE